MPYKGSMVKTSKVPVDKFTLDNYDRFLVYKSPITKVPPERIKFGDEKLLKGQDLFDREV